MQISVEKQKNSLDLLELEDTSMSPETVDHPAQTPGQADRAANLQHEKSDQLNALKFESDCNPFIIQGNREPLASIDGNRPGRYVASSSPGKTIIRVPRTLRSNANSQVMDKDVGLVPADNKKTETTTDQQGQLTTTTESSMPQGHPVSRINGQASSTTTSMLSASEQRESQSSASSSSSLYMEVDNSTTDTHQLSGESTRSGRQSIEPRPLSSLGHAPRIEDFEILKPISRGAFGKVFLCHRKDQPKKKLAVKVLKKQAVIEKNLVSQVIAERNALAITKSPFCVNLYYCLQTTKNVFLVMDYMIGGDLKSLLGVYGFFEEHMAVFYIAEVILALEYLHSKGIVHRDVKPDNMLLSHTGHIKLTDFGLSTVGIDRELQVADLIPKTPFTTGRTAPKHRLVRTPGQILSLTSHISFQQSHNQTPSFSMAESHSHSLGGSFHEHTTSPTKKLELGKSTTGSLTLDPQFCPSQTSLSSQTASFHKPIIPNTPVGSSTQKLDVSETPATRGQRFVRRKSFCDVLDFRGRKRLSKSEASSSSAGEENSAGQLTDMSLGESDARRRLPALDHSPSSSVDYNQPLKSRALCPPDPDSNNDENKHSSSNSSDLCLSQPEPVVDDVFSDEESDAIRSPPRLPPGSPQDDNNSRGSFSSSPKHMAESSMDMSPMPTLSPVARVTTRIADRKDNAPTPRYPDPKEMREELGKHTPNIPQDEVENVLTSQAAANIRGIRDCTPETLRAGESFDSDLHLDCQLNLNFNASAMTDSPERELSTNSSNLDLNRTTQNFSETSYSQYQDDPPNESSEVAESTEDDMDISHASIGLTQDSSGHHANSGQASEHDGLNSIDHSLEQEDPNSSSGSPRGSNLPLSANKEVVERNAARKFKYPSNSSSLLTRKRLRSPGSEEDTGSGSHSTGLTQDIGQILSLSKKLCKIPGDNNESAVSFMDISLGAQETPRRKENLLSSNSVDMSPGPCPPSEEDRGTSQAPEAIERSEMTGGQEKGQLSSSGSDNSHRSSCSDQELIDGSRERYQYSTPLSALPQHMKALANGQKGVKAVKFLSPAGVTPVAPPSHLAPPAVSSDSSESKDLSCGVSRPVDLLARLQEADGSNFTTPASSPECRTPRTGPTSKVFRTPKSVGRKAAAGQSEGKIMGTPDYMAPELLLRQKHDEGVDWWAVGVCLYELMVGIPPFNDTTPELVFNNILSLNLEWPEGEESLSEAAMEAIISFLKVDPSQRANGASIKQTALMKDVNWEGILEEEAPFVPQPDDASDTTYFTARNNMQGLKVSQVDL